MPGSPDKLSDREFTEEAFWTILQRSPEDQALHDFTTALQNGVSRQQALYNIVESAEFIGRLQTNAPVKPEYNADTDEEFLEKVYQLFLSRAIDASGKSDWLSRITLGVSRENIIAAIAHSEEFTSQLHKRLDTNDFAIPAHAARVKFICEELPPARHILDLGGGCPYDPQGALLALGYPHTPESITIVDLPETLNMVPRPRGNDVVARDNITIHYIEGSMTDLQSLPRNYFDLVWMGESIEHISPESADQLFRDLPAVMTSNAKLIMDTPNRRVTGIYMPDNWIHNEHFIEYTPQQLIDKLQAAGFTVEKTLGLIAMSESIAKQTWLSAEMASNAPINNCPDDSVMFCCFCVYTGATQNS